MTFSDGMKINTSGPYRVISRSDGLYVTGNGMLCAVDTYEEGKALIDSLSGPCQQGAAR